MYQTVIPSPIIMQVIGNQQTSVQCPTTETHPAINPNNNNCNSNNNNNNSNTSQQSDRKISSYTRNNRPNRHRFIQNNHFPVELYQMMRVDLPPIRKSYDGGNSGNWHRRNVNYNSFVPSSNVNNFRPHHNNHNYNNNNNYNNNSSISKNTQNNNNLNNKTNINNNNNNTNNISKANSSSNNSNNDSKSDNNLTSSSHSNINININNNYNNSGINNSNNNNSGPVKKHNWNNRTHKRNTFREQLSQHKEGPNQYNSDSGFSSRSPTPSKHCIDSQNDITNDHKSIASTAKSNTEKHEEICPSPMTNITLTPQGFIQSIPNVNQFFPNHQVFGFYPANFNPLVRPTQLPQNNSNSNSNFNGGSANSSSNSINNNNNNNNGKKRYQTDRNNLSPSKNHRGRKCMNPVMPIFTNVLPKTHLAPDRYLARAQLIPVMEVPKNLLGSADWDNLSKDIWTKFYDNQQSENTFKKKMMLWKYLFIYIKTVYPKYSVFLVGSTMNGFGSDSSDVDICLIVRNTEIIQRTEAILHLNQIMATLQHCDFIKQLELIEAKVPILKFQDTMQNLDIDLNCNNAVGVRNTHMLYCYSQIDWRVRPLVLVVKLWAQSQGINDAKNMTISSYSLALMVIHFLQCGVDPPVLPCLQSTHSEKFNPHSDVHAINIHEDLEINFEKTNNQPLGELFYEFFKYYVNFDFTRYAISVRLAQKLPIDECRFARTWKNSPHQWKFLCIEEPFDLTNTARSVFDYDVFVRIITVFRRSHQRLKDTNNLANIFVNLVPRGTGIRYPSRPPVS